MNQFIHIEPDQCIACGTCMAACIDSHRHEGLQAAPRIRVSKKGEISSISTCHHCESPTCAFVCPVDAISIMDDFVLVHEQQCITCGMCSLACPFGAIQPHGTSVAGVAGIKFDIPLFCPSTSGQIAWEIGVRKVAVKCDLCKSSGHPPACAGACPTRALVLVDNTVSVESVAIKHELAAESAPLAPQQLTENVERG